MEKYFIAAAILCVIVIVSVIVAVTTTAGANETCDIAAKIAEIDEARKKMQDLTTQLSIAQEANKKTAAQLAAVSARVDADDAEVIGLRTSLAEANAKIIAAQNTVTSLDGIRGQMVAMQNMLEKNASTIASARKAVTGLTESYKILKSAADSAINAVDAVEVTAITWNLTKLADGRVVLLGTDSSGGRRCYTTDDTSNPKAAVACAQAADLARAGKLVELTDNSPALVCGADHAARYGTDGISAAGHWCNPATAVTPLMRARQSFAPASSAVAALKKVVNASPTAEKIDW